MFTQDAVDMSYMYFTMKQDSFDLVCFFQKFASLDKQTRPSFHTYETPYYSRFYYSEDIKAFFELLQAFKYVFV